MATAVDGVITLSFRPLATMDELHILLLAAVSVQTSDVSFLEQVFSLPSNVVVKELVVLEAYGLTQKVGDQWTATGRGQKIADVWNMFQKRAEIDVQTGGLQWLLGPGEFAVNEMIRDRDEIEALARDFEIADAASSVKFLGERRRASEKFESFVREGPSRPTAATEHDNFADAIFFDSVRLAENDEALARLEELLATHIGEIVDRFKKKDVTDVHADGKKNNDAAGLIRTRGQDIMKKFKEAKQTQRRQNQYLAKVKMISEALLAGQWLSANVAPLEGAFNTEPAAFIFISTVPLVQAEAHQWPASMYASSPSSAKPKQEEKGVIRSPSTKSKQEEYEEGVMRSLFRWLFG